MDLANAALLESWQLSLHEKRPRTREVYLRELDRFVRWLEARGEGDLCRVSKRDVQTWIGEQQARGLKTNTVRARWIALRSFYGWAFIEGEVGENPVAAIVVGRSRDEAPAPLTPEEIAALFKACEGTGFLQRRDLAMFRFMIATGLRLSETANLLLADLDLPNRVAYVRDGKGGKARIARFDAATAAALDRYKRVRARHRYAHTPNLWVGQLGPIRRSGIPKLLDNRSRAAGIGHVFPHQLRHTFADRYLKAGGTEGDLMRLGGWESATIMRRYGEARAVDRALGAYDDVDPMKGL